MRSLKDFGILMASFFVGLAAYEGQSYIKGDQPFNNIPRDIDIREGFVKPSRLQINLQDVGHRGSNSTILEYDGKKYFLKLDDKKEPIVTPFKYDF
tara:strand:- start:459 stop:746 length:288 start_codon:yes stop_codon:yes gene_type:complete